MATGDRVAYVCWIQPPETLYAYENWYVGPADAGGEPKRIHPLWSVTLNVKDRLDWYCHADALPAAATSFQLQLPWYSSATTGTCRWTAAVRRISTTDQLSAAHTWFFNNMVASVSPNTSTWAPTYSVWTISNIDGLVKGEDFILRTKLASNTCTDVRMGWGLNFLEV
jgi:hypothetical protein